MYCIKRIRKNKIKTCGKPSGGARFEGMMCRGGLHFGRGITLHSEVWWWWGCKFECARRGKGPAPKKPETECGGSVSGVTCQMVVENDGGRWWGTVDEVVVVVGGCAFESAQGGLGPKKPEN